MKRMPASKKNLNTRKGAAWTLSELNRLGKKPDSVLGHQTGRTIKEIVAMRVQRRIRLPTGPRRWTAREIKLLGRYFDAELARRLRRNINDVRQQRLLLHIPSIRPAKSRKWTPAQDKLLGTRPDREIAKRLNRKTWNVSWRRRLLDIPCFYERRPWTKLHLAMLGIKTDEDAARLTGHPLKAVCAKRWELGKPKPDQVMNYWTPDQDREGRFLAMKNPAVTTFFQVCAAALRDSRAKSRRSKVTLQIGVNPYPFERATPAGRLGCKGSRPGHCSSHSARPPAQPPGHSSQLSCHL